MASVSTLRPEGQGALSSGGTARGAPRPDTATDSTIARLGEAALSRAGALAREGASGLLERMGVLIVVNGVVSLARKLVEPEKFSDLVARAAEDVQENWEHLDIGFLSDLPSHTAVKERLRREPALLDSMEDEELYTVYRVFVPIPISCLPKRWQFEKKGVSKADQERLFQASKERSLAGRSAFERDVEPKHRLAWDQMSREERLQKIREGVNRRLFSAEAERRHLELEQAVQKLCEERGIENPLVPKTSNKEPSSRQLLKVAVMVVVAVGFFLPSSTVSEHLDTLVARSAKNRIYRGGQVTSIPLPRAVMFLRLLVRKGPTKQLISMIYSESRKMSGESTDDRKPTKN